MKMILNGLTFSAGGGAIKITDYLEDPVDISTLSVAEIHERLTQGLVLFGSFLIAEHDKKVIGYSHIGYIPTQSYSSYLDLVSTTDRAFVVLAYHASNLFLVFIPLFYNEETYGTALPIHTRVYLNDDWVYNTKGKIWIGDYKQIVQE